MKTKLIGNGPQRRFAVTLDKGDEVVKSLLAVAREHQIKAGHFRGFGTLCYTVVGRRAASSEAQTCTHIDGQVEVLSLEGDIALEDDRSELHPHVVVGRADGTTHGGELLEAHVRPALELLIEETVPSSLSQVQGASGGPVH